MALLSSASAFAANAYVQVRVGQTITYFQDCQIATNILEPGAADESYLIVRTCKVTEVVESIAPSWIRDSRSSYGQTIVNDHGYGECWLIRQQLLDSGSRSVLVECRDTNPMIFRSGFEDATLGSPR